MWVVTLVKPPMINDFRDDFFPRYYGDKRDAEALVKEVATKGGEAKVEKAPKKSKK